MRYSDGFEQIQDVKADLNYDGKRSVDPNRIVDRARRSRSQLQRYYIDEGNAQLPQLFFLLY
jgi:hypothetical protein